MRNFEGNFVRCVTPPHHHHQTSPLDRHTSPPLNNICSHIRGRWRNVLCKLRTSNEAIRPKVSFLFFFCSSLADDFLTMMPAARTKWIFLPAITHRAIGLSARNKRVCRTTTEHRQSIRLQRMLFLPSLRQQMVISPLILFDRVHYQTCVLSSILQAQWVVATPWRWVSRC